MLFWKQFVVRRVLQPALNLESLAIIRYERWDIQDLDISQALFATHPPLAALSLRNIVWEQGTIVEGNIVTPLPLEDFILRHRRTLKNLELRGCSIGVQVGAPLCYWWAAIFTRLTAALTELVEPGLELGSESLRHGSFSPCRGDNLANLVLYWGMRTEMDVLALKEFDSFLSRTGQLGALIVKLNGGGER